MFSRQFTEYGTTAYQSLKFNELERNSMISFEMNNTAEELFQQAKCIRLAMTNHTWTDGTEAEHGLSLGPWMTRTRGDCFEVGTDSAPQTDPASATASSSSSTARSLIETARKSAVNWLSKGLNFGTG